MKLSRLPKLFGLNLGGAFLVSVILFTVSMRGTPRHWRNYFDLLQYAIVYAVPATAIAYSQPRTKPTPLEAAKALSDRGYIDAAQYVHIADTENHKSLFGD